MPLSPSCLTSLCLLTRASITRLHIALHTLPSTVCAECLPQCVRNKALTLLHTHCNAQQNTHCNTHTATDTLHPAHDKTAGEDRRRRRIRDSLTATHTLQHTQHTLYNSHSGRCKVPEKVSRKTLRRVEHTNETTQCPTYE